MMTEDRRAIISGGVPGSGPVGLLDCPVSSSGHWLYKVIQTLKSLDTWFTYNSVCRTSMKILWKNNIFTSMIESDWEKGKTLAQSYQLISWRVRTAADLMARHILFPSHQDFILNSEGLPRPCEGPCVFLALVQEFLVVVLPGIQCPLP